MAYNPGMTSTAQTVRAKGEMYDVAFNLSDPKDFAALMGTQFDSMKTSSIYSKGTGFKNDLEMLQATVRSAKGTAFESKGTSMLGDISLEDYNAIQKLFQTSYLMGTDWLDAADRSINSPYLRSGSFSKSVQVALRTLDPTDAESILNKAYYEAFGSYPTQKNLEKFRTDFNKEATRQATKTTTTGTDGKSKVVTTGGFTEAEQDEFIADFMQKNFKITGKEQTGYVKNLINTISKTYEANLLPPDDMQGIIEFAAQVVGTGDTNIQKQMVEGKLQSIRNIAAKFNPGVADVLSNGEDVISYLTPVVKKVNETLGTNLTASDERFKKVINYNDGKTTRVMNSAEIENFVKEQPEYQTSSTAINKYTGWGQAIKDALR